MSKISPDAHIGAVDLNVRDIDTVSAFYQRALGLRKRPSGEATMALGADETLLRIHHTPDASPRKPQQSGLFHIAYLVPTRADLGRALRHFVDERIPLQGASDHLVSEAIYLADPEGNGIEVYADRPREEWPRLDGKITMATEPMDAQAVLAAGADTPWNGAPAGTRVGHIHIQVPDVQAAQAFYTESIGLDLIARYGADASFLSAGGYHHHLGVNAWGTRGGRTADPTALGLRAFEIIVPDSKLREVTDPGGNAIRLVDRPGG